MQVLRDFIPFSLSTRRLQSTFAIFIDPESVLFEKCNFKESPFLQNKRICRKLCLIEKSISLAWMQVLRDFIPFSLSARRLQSTFGIFIDPESVVFEKCNFKESSFLQKKRKYRKLCLIEKSLS